jgi:hypothetical protein
MSILSVIGRIFINLVKQPGAIDVLTKVGHYAARQATAALIRHVQNQTRPQRKTMSKIS